MEGEYLLSSFLQEIYCKIYDDVFSYDDFESRKKLQKAVYLLENMGVYIGDYSFSWDTYGPYSLSLDCTASQIRENDEIFHPFSEFAEECFGKVKNIVNQNSQYDCAIWMECVASLHYLKNVFRYKDETVIDELVKRKPYLTNIEANRQALKIANTIKVGI